MLNRRSVSDPVLQSLVVALVLTKLDCCSATLAGLPAVQLDRLDRLPSVLNAAARLIYRRRKFDHVSPLLKELHWLQVPDRITFRLSALAYRCLSAQRGAALPHRITTVVCPRLLTVGDSVVLFFFSFLSFFLFNFIRCPCNVFDVKCHLNQYIVTYLLIYRLAPTGEQRWLPAASTLVVVSHARCTSHRTRDHRWPCVQFNCSSCVEQFANGSAVF